MNIKKLSLLCLLLPLVAQAESELTTANQAKSSLQFQVIIPTIIEVTNHYRPATAVTGLNQERLSITHNLRQLCLEAVLNGTDPTWILEVEEYGWQIDRTLQGYKLCTRNRGQINLTMKHHFNSSFERWPVQLTFQPL